MARFAGQARGYSSSEIVAEDAYGFKAYTFGDF